MKLIASTRFAVACAMAFLFVLAFSSCKKRRTEPLNPAFAEYISAFTSGNVSAATTIRIRLTDAFSGEVNTTEPVTDALLDISPSVDGQLFWVDNQTLEFRPAQWLERGETYHVEFHLGKIVNVPAELKEFRFSFIVVNQHLDVNVSAINHYRAEDLANLYLTGTVVTADVCDLAALETTVTAEENGRTLPVRWTHESGGRLHNFTVDSISRSEAAQKVTVRWNGDAIDADQSGEVSHDIPALGDFNVILCSVVQQPDQYVVINFSDPLQPGQTLDGLVEIMGESEVRIAAAMNEVRLYPSVRLNGRRTVYVHSGVKNILGYPMKMDRQFEVDFEDLKPEVEIPDPNKVILPSTDGLVFPFRAVNLSAVDVSVVRIYENNVAQFLQVNDLFGDNEIRRVGRPVATKTISLNQEKGTNLAQWNTFYLDLDDIIKAEPGAIYRVEIGFKRSYSLYPCVGGNEEEESAENEVKWDDASAQESSYWDAYESYYYDDYSDEYYDWDYEYDERDNPCNKAYYKSRRPKGKNILASDLGLIVKKGNDGSMVIATSDLRTAEPMEDVTVEILNYQQQVLQRVTTNGDGLATVEKLSGVPFLAVATKGQQKGYLKVSDGLNLSVSTFDVSGAQTDKGLKGFIYGERGVWRPGDTLFLSFILQDERKTLPEVHPVQLELINPRGRHVHKAVKSKGEGGIYRFTTPTDAAWETGNYTANVRVGGAVFSKTIKIEMIKPNRLKMTMDFGKDKLSAVDGNSSATLAVKWLHGAVARNLKAVVTSTFTQSTTAFDRYNEFTFDDPVRSFTPEEKTIFEGQVNSEGLATVTLNTEMEDAAPGMLNANFNVRVFEEGGDFSVDRQTIPYSPYNTYVGVRLPKGDAARGMLLTDTDHKVEVVTVNSKGQASGNKNLTWNVYKVSWRWWWESNKDDLASYVGSESTTPIASGTLSTNGEGKGSFAFKVNYPDWGRYLVRVEDGEGGHATGKTVYIDWPGWAGRAQRENPGGASMLLFNMDKEKYSVGEKCSFSFPSSGVGRALVTIENGARVLRSEWIDVENERTAYTFDATEDLSPNAYVSVTLVQPHAQTANDAPIRLYGVVPVFVENPNSHLEPVIAMADELEPEKGFDVRVSEKSGRGMSYTLAIVDEGLLDLTRFKTPDPWNHFYAREALGVSTYDVYDQVIGAFGAKVEKLLGLGGDDAAGGKGKNRANRFKPVVMYAGPFTLEKGQSKSHHFTMPNYIGSVRVMVVAANDPAYGNAEKAVPVKKPLMVLATLPRVIGPGEEVKLPVNVFAMDKNVKQVNVKVESNGFLQGAKTSQSLSFNQPGDEVVNFSFNVAQKIGVAKVKVTATSGNLKSTYEVEVEVRNPNPVITTVMDGTAAVGQTWSGNTSLPGVDGTNEITLEVSALPALNLNKHLKYLLDYPHGCAEQTTSQAFPQLYVSNVIDLNESAKQRASENVKAAVKKLSGFQTGSGGFAYWPGQNEVNDWISSYVGHFLLEAKAKGFAVSQTALNNWSAYQKRAAQAWRPNGANAQLYYSEEDLIQAYRLYTLAMYGQPDQGAMNRLREKQDLSIAGKWRLAAAYALMGQEEVAKQLAYSASRTVAPYNVSYGTYGSSVRDEAMIAETLLLIGDRGGALAQVRQIATELGGSGWYSTQSLAYSLKVIATFMEGESGSQVKFNYAVNGKWMGEKTSQRGLISVPLSAAGAQKLEVKNTSGNMLFVRVICTGQPAAGNEQDEQSRLNMTVNYTDMRGNPINVARLQQGTDFMAEVTLTHPGGDAYKRMALTQIFPSGWEITNARMDVTAAALSSSMPEYQDFRDDRVLTYFSLYPSQPMKFKVKLNATYMGKFYLPAVQCEAMYDHSIHAVKKGEWVEVVPAGGGVIAAK